jgi:cell division protease FtsH
LERKKLITLSIWIILCAAFFYLIDSQQSKPQVSPDSRLAADLESDQVLSFQYNGKRGEIELENGAKYEVDFPLTSEIYEKLDEAGIQIQTKKEDKMLDNLITAIVPVLLIIIVFLYYMKSANKAGAGILGLKKHRAKDITDRTVASFKDVAGCNEAKEVLKDVVSYLSDPPFWKSCGARAPRGVLLEGPPGCGKTLLARALAGETKAKFFAVSASEFVEMFVGVGAARIRDMFEEAVKAKPAVIYIDELDALGRRRGSGVGFAHEEREQTLNQLLVCMDGFENHDGIVVIGSTNRADVLDPALLRPGRFDRRVKVGQLSTEERIEAFKIHTKNKALAEDIDFPALAALTEGYRGCDVADLAERAVLTAMRKFREKLTEAVKVTTEDFKNAVEQIKLQVTTYPAVDALLFESSSQPSHPVRPLKAELTLENKEVLTGELLWSDSSFIKIRLQDSTEVMVAKRALLKIVSLESGTEVSELSLDKWGNRHGSVA